MHRLLQDERYAKGFYSTGTRSFAREREVLLGTGTIEVRAPRVNDRRVDQGGNRKGFKSVIVPPPAYLGGTSQ